VLHDADIEASACVHSFHYAVLCYAIGCIVSQTFHRIGDVFVYCLPGTWIMLE